MPFRPKLPPKAGYVEVEVDGRRTYKNAKTGILIENEKPVTEPEPTTDEILDTLLGVTADE